MERDIKSLLMPPPIEIFLFLLVGLIVSFACRSRAIVTVIVWSVVATLALYILRIFLDSGASRDLRLSRLLVEISVLSAAGLIAPLLVFILRAKLEHHGR